MSDDTDAGPTSAPEKKTFLQEWSGFLIFVIVMVFFRVTIADWNHVPSGSMRPTLIEGDRIWVNKLAYDVKVPYTDIVLKKNGDPQRGDIIVFNSPVDGTRLVKRIVGIPGDEITYANHQMFLNGKKVEYVPMDPDTLDLSLDKERRSGYGFFTEMLPGHPHPVLHSPSAPREVLAGRSFTVQPGEYVALGDNRDHSNDSRFWGTVPRANIIGRTRSVVLSFNRDNFYLPRASRFFISLP